MDTTELFIASIKNHELLYDKNNPNYGNDKRKNQVWEDLSKEFNFDAKEKWHSLREKFLRERKKYITVADYRSPWSLYNDISFIDNHIKTRRRLQKSFSVFVPGEDEDEENIGITVMDDLKNSEIVETKFSKSTEVTIPDSFSFFGQQEAKPKEITTERFISIIKNHELLYNKDNPNFCNNKRKEEIWEELSQEFNCDAKKKWNTLREKFVRERKKYSKVPDQSPWSFYNDMSFMDIYVQNRSKLQKSSSVFVPGKDEGEDNIEVINETYNDFYTVMGDLNNSEIVETKSNSTKSNKSTERTITDSFSFSSQQEAKPKRRNMDSTQENMLKILRTLKKITENIECTNDNDDEDTAFIALIAQKMRRMSSAEKSMFQVEVLKKAVEISSKTDVYSC